jgi:carbon monoxide dehydrogenase subunit G
MSMELNHSFTVPVPPDQAWNVLLDVEKIAPCMPGAQVDTVDGDDVAGQLKVKVGPVSLTYKGTATFKDRDTVERSVLVEASGKETRGSGTASATVRAALSPEDSSDSGTLVTLHTTLNVTGKPAQFGRGVIAEVGSRLIDKFADNLAKELANGGVATAPAAGTPAPAAAPDTPDATAATTPSEATSNGGPSAAAPSATAPAAPSAAAATAPAAAPTVHVPVQSAPEPVQPVPVQHREDSLNLLSLVGPVIAKRLAPVAGAAAAVGLLTWGIRRVLRRRKSA